MQQGDPGSRNGIYRERVFGKISRRAVCVDQDGASGLQPIHDRDLAQQAFVEYDHQVRVVDIASVQDLFAPGS